jgi:hypothetical protein
MPTAVDAAMLCLRNIFDNLEGDTAVGLFASLDELELIGTVLKAFASPVPALGSFAIRCTLARLFYSISRSAELLDAAVLGLKDHIVVYVEAQPIDWPNSPLDLWLFVDSLPVDSSDAVAACRSFINTELPKTLTIDSFADCQLVPACVPVLSILDSGCEFDRNVYDQCIAMNIPATILHHSVTTTCDDSARACLRLLGKFLELDPDGSPFAPPFVAELPESQYGLLDDLIPLALSTCERCSQPGPWFDYAVDVLNTPLPHPVRLFYTSCICACHQFFDGPLPPMGDVVPVLCDIVKCPLSDRESALAMLIRYARDSASLAETSGHDVGAFLSALSALSAGDLKEMADDGSANAGRLLQLLDELTAQNEESNEPEKGE